MYKIVLQELPHHHLHRVKEINRSEEIEVVYAFTCGELIRTSLPHHSPTFSDQMWAELMAEWQECLQEGGSLIGALDGDTLAGFTILRPRLQGTMAQLMALYISRPYRRQGIAQQLYDELEAQAINSEATAIYVSATETGSAVGFYTKQGFRPTTRPHPRLFALEPKDIHMIKQLKPEAVHG